MFIVVISDRHSGLELVLFSDYEKAETFCRARFAEVVAHPELINEDKDTGRMVLLNYGPAEDYAFVDEIFTKD